MYAALETQPDIPYGVSALSGYHLWPFTSNMTAAKWILRYLETTANCGLHFSDNGIGNSLVGYWDSDWANDSTNCNSEGGRVFLVHNGAVWWQSRKEGLIAMSSLEVIFIACSQASRDAKRFLQPQKDIHSYQRDSPLLWINRSNHGALTLITMGIIKARTKHIDICNYNSRDQQKGWIVNNSHLHMDDNLADIFTKPQSKDQYSKFMKAMALWQWWFIGGQSKVLRLFHLFFGSQMSLCIYGWLSSGYCITLSLLTSHAGCLRRRLCESQVAHYLCLFVLFLLLGAWQQGWVLQNKTHTGLPG